MSKILVVEGDVNVQVPLPIFMVRVPDPEKLAVTTVILLLLVAKSSVPVNAPAVSVVMLSEA